MKPSDDLEVSPRPGAQIDHDLEVGKVANKLRYDVGSVGFPLVGELA
jgi:hypothetical protein